MYDHVLPTFAATVRRLRKARGYTQESFADHAGMDRAFFGRIERGEQNIAILTIMRLASALEVPPAELFRDISLTDLRTSD